MARNSNSGVIDLIAASPPRAGSLCNELHQRAQCDKYPCGYGYLPPQTGLDLGQFSGQSQLKTSNLVLNLGYLITEKTSSGNSIKIILASHVPKPTCASANIQRRVSNKRREIDPEKQKTPAFAGVSHLRNLAATYSPRGSTPKYHWRVRA